MSLLLYKVERGMCFSLCPYGVSFAEFRTGKCPILIATDVASRGLGESWDRWWWWDWRVLASPNSYFKMILLLIQMKFSLV